MPATILKRVLYTLAGCVVVVTFVHGNDTYDYIYECGRGVYTDDVALASMERAQFMHQALTLFLKEVHLGGTPS